ncbi:hypothetical protein O6466_24105, partial [Salmonella enterica subsp. enterica]
KQGFSLGQTHTGDGAKFARRATYAKQFRHEMTNVSTMCLAKTLLDKGFEHRAQRVAGQGPEQIHLRGLGLAEVKR